MKAFSPLFFLFALIVPAAGLGRTQLKLQPIRVISYNYPGTYGTIGCTFDRKAGLFHVAFFPKGEIYSFNFAGKFVRKFSTRPYPVPAYSPNGLTWNPADGLLYIVDNDGPVVVACTSMGTYVRGWKFKSPTSNPVGICWNSDRGTLVISSNRTLSEWTRAGVQVPSGTIPFGTSILAGVAYVPQTGHYLVVKSGGSSIYEIDAKGKQVSTTSLSSYGVKNTQDINYDPESGILTVVCNSTLKLYAFAYKPGGIVTYGEVCAGSGGWLPARSWSGALATGKTAKIQVSQVLGGATVLHFLGRDRTKLGPVGLPFDLGPLGAKGCYLNMAPIFFYGTRASGTGNGAGTASFTLSIPPNSVYVGTTLYDQWMVLDKGANSLGLVFSSGGILRITR